MPLAGPCCPCPVFRLWCGLQSGCQFFRSHKGFLSPRCGMMWSTSVAAAIRPRSVHAPQSGFFCRNARRAFRHLLS